MISYTTLSAFTLGITHAGYHQEDTKYTRARKDKRGVIRKMDGQHQRGHERKPEDIIIILGIYYMLFSPRSNHMVTNYKNIVTKHWL